jgi:integrase
MSIRKRGNFWWIDIRSPNGGERIRRSAETTNRQAAQELHDGLKVDLWRIAKLGETPQYTFEEAAVRFLKVHALQKDYSSKCQRIAHFRQHFAGWKISSIKAADVMKALPEFTMGRKQTSLLKPASRNRYLSTIRKLLNDCERWEWIERAPKLSAEKEPRKRIRWITKAEALRLLSAIRMDWFRDCTGFALATGMRAGEIFDLHWSQVDLVLRMAWLHPDQCKNGEARGVPLNEDAVEIIRRQIGKHDELVFTRNRKQIKSEDHNQFKRACRVAGIENFRFHDLRHTWSSWHVQGGTPIYVLKELGGWKTLEMVQKYAHLAPEHLAPHANVVTFWSQCNAVNEVGKKKAG